MAVVHLVEGGRRRASVRASEGSYCFYSVYLEAGTFVKPCSHVRGPGHQPGAPLREGGTGRMSGATVLYMYV